MKEFGDYIAAREALARVFGVDQSEMVDVSMNLECKWRIHDDYVEWGEIEDPDNPDDVEFDFSMDLGKPHTSKCGLYIMVCGFDGGDSQSVIFRESNRLPNVK